jgi:pyridinium-3,5-bisthiocarboxylic acid mononucleotide nickel chelatase
MNTLYLDIFSGISGDMFIGALLDLGVDAHQFEHELKKLRVGGYHLHVGRGQKSQITGVKFDVHLESDHDHDHDHGHNHAHDILHGHPHSHSHGHSHSHSHTRSHEHEHGRTHAEIRKLIQDSALSDWVKDKALRVFQRIAVAEGKIHGVPPADVHFHEVGAVDSIVDIVGACVALEILGKPRVIAAPVVEGTGWIDCAHGRFPIPAPATLEILGAAGIGVTQCDEPHELVTPTGAALLAEFAEIFGPMRGLVAGKIGVGLGTRDNQTRPNVLRAILGSAESAPPGANDWQADTVAVLETNLDDSTAEIIGHFVQRALDAGALDVFHTPIQMKKNRPGVLLTVLCAAADADKFTEMMLRETTAFGVRRNLMERRKLQREFVTVKTDYGDVTMKVGKLNGKVIQAAPEYESCRKLAEQAGVPLKLVYEAANQAMSLED